MWNADKGSNFIRLLDQKNAMGRHYKKLGEIKKRELQPKFVNVRYEKTLRKPRRHAKVKVNRARAIYSDNKKILKALENISKRWRVFSPDTQYMDKEVNRNKTLGFKKKSNRDMIKENIR